MEPQWSTEVPRRPVSEVRGERRGTGRTRGIDLDRKLPASFSQSRPALFHSVT